MFSNSMFVENNIYIAVPLCMDAVLNTVVAAII